jgi:phosphatidylinositol-3-phosphatase
LSKPFPIIGFILLFLLVASCGGGPSGSGGTNGGGGSGGTGGGGGTPPPTGSSASVEHVVIVVFENQNYSDVIGNSAMPYINQLARQNSLATQFYANVHPSIGNYFMMTTGQVVSTDDNFAGTFSGEDVTQAITAAGKTWKVYAESLPSVGYIDGDQYPYIKHHNPFSYFDDVRSSATQRNNIAPFTDFAPALAANTLPNYAFIVPDNLHNGHDCPSGPTCSNSDRLAAIDSWLQTNVGPMLANSSISNSSLLMLTFDESASDNTLGGGRIPVVLAGGQIKTSFQSTTTYQFPSLLRFSLKSLGVTSFPGASANAPDMDEFLK